MANFALIGAAGYVAPRHMQAIRDTGNRLVAAVDLHDAVGVLDRFSFDVSFFTEIERFDRHLEKLKRRPDGERVDWVSVCSPNYLHDAHCRLAMRIGANVVCEKPLVINPWNLDALAEFETETGARVFNVLQLRLHPDLIALKARLDAEPHGARRQVDLTYITARGAWYRYSWKGAEEKSGGIATNIGIHFFDLLMWLFGAPGEIVVHHADADRMAGFIALERADVRWFLSVDPGDLPFPAEPGRRSTFRSIQVDGREIEFSEGFADLHTRVYECILDGRGFGIETVRPSIELTHRIRTASVTPDDDRKHPTLLSR